jgi:hypothetical protein
MANPAPACGDYFAEDRYLAADPEAGLLRNPAGTPILVLPRDLLDSLREAISAEFGPKADRVFAAAGRKWGEAFAARFQRELSEYYGAPLGEWPFARLETCIVSALDRLGWGRAELDTTRFGQGVFTVRVRESFAKESLMAGMLGGVFSALTGQDLDAVATGQDNGASTFVIALRERIERLTTTTQDAVVAELATIRA